MTKRKADTYEDALKDFSVLLRKQVANDFATCNTQNKQLALGRRLAYLTCLRELESALEKNGLSLAHIGLGGYKLPEVE